MGGRACLHLHESHQARVDGEGHLHRKLGRDNRRHDQDAVEEELVPAAFGGVLHAFPQYVARRRDGEDEEKQHKADGVLGVGPHCLRAALDHAHQFALHSE